MILWFEKERGQQSWHSKHSNFSLPQTELAYWAERGTQFQPPLKTSPRPPSSMPRFCTVLKRLPGSRNTLPSCGMESHICVTQTAPPALRDGYLLHVASDAVSSRTEWNWKIGLDRMHAAGAVIWSTEMMIHEC